MNVKEYLVYGAGGFAREVAWLIESASDDNHPNQIKAFIDDNPLNVGQSLNGIPIVSFNMAMIDFLDVDVVIAIGSPSVRQTVTEKTIEAGFSIGRIIHPRTEMSRLVTIGEGVVICAGNILTTNIQIESHVHINIGCTLGHDVILRDYVTLAPGVHISGYVHLHERAYIGTGAVIINGTKESPIIIGSDAVIGAGACVTKSVEAGTTVVGIPAKPLQKK